MTNAIVLIFFVSTRVFAETCLEIPEAQMKEWMNLRPKSPALAFLLKAKKIVDAEKDYALSLGTDKTAHCYLGCRVNGEVNFQTAQFLAWQKEHSDATDCNPDTYFDVADYEATLFGAQLASNECVNTCKKVY